MSFRQIVERIKAQALDRREWLQTPEGQEWKRQQERQAERARRAELVKAADLAGVPSETGIRSVALDDTRAGTDALDAVAKVLEWREARCSRGSYQPAVLVLSGPPGVGKSCAAAWGVTHAKRSGAYVTASKVGATPRSGYSTNEESWQAWLSADVLALDDMGTERGDPGLLGWLLTERWNEGRLTFATANVSQADFVARYVDARLLDRLERGQRRHGLEWFVKCGGASLRGMDFEK